MGRLFDKDTRYGCGSGIFFIKDDLFYMPCKQHDIDYEEKILTQREADDCFLKYMKEIAKTPRQRIRAYIYYGIVRTVGRIFWRR